MATISPFNQMEDEEEEEELERRNEGLATVIVDFPDVDLPESRSPDMRVESSHLVPWDLERLQQQLNSSTQTSSSEFDSLVDMLGSRQQRIVPLMTSSWLEYVNKYSELEGDSAIFASQDSLEVLNWSTHDCGRPGSPLRFDHEEILRIDEDEENDSGRGGSISPTRQLDASLTSNNLSVRFSDLQVARMPVDLDEEREAKLQARNGYRCPANERREEESNLRRQCSRLSDEKQRLTDQISRLQKSHEGMKGVIADYESTIQKLLDGKEGSSVKLNDSFSDITKERDQAVEDLRSVESAFSDLHRRYEKTKQAVDAYKKNEDILRKCVEDLKQKLKKQDERYRTLKEKAEGKLGKANTEIESLKRRLESDVAGLNAALKKAEVQIESLQKTIEQKTKENEELSSIYDELIARIGSKRC